MIQKWSFLIGHSFLKARGLGTVPIIKTFLSLIYTCFLLKPTFDKKNNNDLALSAFLLKLLHFDVCFNKKV